MNTRIPNILRFTQRSGRRPAGWRTTLAAVLLACALPPVWGHVVPPEKLHPVAEAYVRASFLLNLNPVVFEQVRPDVQVFAEHLKRTDPAAAANLLGAVDDVMKKATLKPGPEKDVERLPRTEAARKV